MNTTFIYSLKCPETNLVRYIGKADNPERRFRDHIRRCKESPSRKNSWIRGLLNEGKQPVLEVIAIVPFDEWQDWERHYINLYREQQIVLVNMTDGGENPPINTRRGYKVSSETSAKFSLARMGNKNSLGHKHSDESRLKMSLAHKGEIPWNKGIAHSKETKRKISEINTGRTTGMHGKKHSEESKRLMSERRMGVKLSAETCKRMSDSRTGNKASEATKKKQSEVSKNRVRVNGKFINK